MVDTEITADQSASDKLSDFRALWNTSKDRRHWTNLVSKAADFDLEVTDKEHMIELDGASSTVDLNLPASDASSAGMNVFYYVSSASNLVQVVPDGSDTISGSTSNLAPAVNTCGRLCSLGNGDWAHFIGSAASAPAALSVGSRSSNYTALTTDGVLAVDSSSGSVTITLFSAGGNTGAVLHIKKVDVSGNQVIVDGSGSETIDGSLTKNITTQWDCLSIVSDGANWLIL